jgi:hypothetical protein
VAQIVYSSPDEELVSYRLAVAERAGRFSVRAIAGIAGGSIGTVSTVRRGLGNPSRDTLTAIDRAIDRLRGDT